MLQLHNLSPKHGAKHRVKRLGCGESSGHGKTSGRGHKGQRARAGGSVRIGFEGGQMPLHRRLPKRGFNNNAFKTVFAIVNLDQLDAFDVETPITEELLRQHGLVRGRVDGLKILGRGELTKPVKVVADHITARAKAEFERVGATFTLVSASKPAKIEVTQSA